MEFYSAMKKNEILSFSSKWMNWRTSPWVRLARFRRPKIIYSPSYVDFRSRVKAVMLLDLGHTSRGEHIWEVWGWVGNPKLESVWCPHCRGANTETLKWQRSTWEGDRELVQRPGRNESIWVVIHLCIEAMLGISLYSYPYLNYKNALSFLLLLMSTVQQNWRKGQNRFCLEARGAGGEKCPNNVCTYE
jgi:hypothetical protein